MSLQPILCPKHSKHPFLFLFLTVVWLSVSCTKNWELAKRCSNLQLLLLCMISWIEEKTRVNEIILFWCTCDLWKRWWKSKTINRLRWFLQSNWAIIYVKTNVIRELLSLETTQTHLVRPKVKGRQTKEIFWSYESQEFLARICFLINFNWR